MKPSKLTALSLATLGCAFVAYKMKDEGKTTKEQLLSGEEPSLRTTFKVATILFGTLTLVELMKNKNK